jgi:acylphosphatase
MTDQTKSVAFHVTGRVQGVSFRAWTQAEAGRLGLSGWVRNRDDGAVEGVAAGPADAVDRLVERLHEGPRLAKVSGVTASPADEAPSGEFEVRG